MLRAQRPRNPLNFSPLKFPCFQQPKQNRLAQYLLFLTSARNHIIFNKSMRDSSSMVSTRTKLSPPSSLIHMPTLAY
ncbi:hypothetical protein SLE2022_306130 [Rubroshorea leprosula]